MNPTTATTAPKSTCADCSVYRSAQLKKLGVNLDRYDYVVALAGNPNTGKSTVFNALTGLRQHTGNWPGKTVARAEGGFEYDNKRYKLIDLPGTYSLLSTSMDEQIARDFLLFGRPNVTLVVADATRLERNLNLVLQVLEITEQVVICLNLMDEARRQGIRVDDRQLTRDLGVPVVPCAARKGEGLPDLLAAVADVTEGRRSCRPYRISQEPPSLASPLQELTGQLKSVYPGLPNARWVALRLLGGDEHVADALRSGELARLYAESPSSSAPAS
jgi:ferrous iron transport protein B